MYNNSRMTMIDLHRNEKKNCPVTVINFATIVKKPDSNEYNQYFYEVQTDKAKLE